MNDDVIRFAHLSDPHLDIVTPPEPAQLLSKRILGWTNWQRKRRHHHRSEILRKITDDIANAQVDLIALTGDVANIALPGEFERAASWVESLGSPDHVMFVPGNHDTYVELDWEKSLGRLASFMKGARLAEHQQTGIDQNRAAESFDDFPYVRQIGPFSFIGLNSSPSTLPGLATGKIGRAQIDRLTQMLQGLEDNSFKIVMLHHPAVKGIVGRHKSLDDGGALLEILKQNPVDLVIHGHAHFPCFSKIDLPSDNKHRSIPHIGVASASYGGKGENAGENGYRPAAQYHLYTVKKSGAQFELHLEVRGLNLDTGRVEKLEDMDLSNGLAV